MENIFCRQSWQTRGVRSEIGEGNGRDLQRCYFGSGRKEFGYRIVRVISLRWTVSNLD
jgi:hypothetical protein